MLGCRAAYSACFHAQVARGQDGGDFDQALRRRQTARVIEVCGHVEAPWESAHSGLRFAISSLSDEMFLSGVYLPGVGSKCRNGIRCIRER